MKEILMVAVKCIQLNCADAEAVIFKDVTLMLLI